MDKRWKGVKLVKGNDIWSSERGKLILFIVVDIATLTAKNTSSGLSLFLCNNHGDRIRYSFRLKLFDT